MTKVGFKENIDLAPQPKAQWRRAMHVTVDRSIVFDLLDALLERWRKRLFPYNKKDAILPQAFLPDDLRANKRTLACFYFYLCIYMRGGIESLQVFRAMVRMWRKYPELFDPLYAQWLSVPYIQGILKEFIGWDSLSAAKSWKENSWRLVQFWGGNPLNLLKKLPDYEEALRRIRNKEETKKERLEAGPDGLGFRGFQPKMVSMLIYFYDWEKWLRPRFIYPSPADFHNFRVGFNQGAIKVEPQVLHVPVSEKISRPWRDAVVAYMKARRADPIKVSDALWLFSLVQCGNSPLTMDGLEVTNGSGIFDEEDLPHTPGIERFLQPRYKRALEATCLRCPIRRTCTLSIPSRPYYRSTPYSRGGRLVFIPRPRIEDYREPIAPDTPLPRDMIFVSEEEKETERRRLMHLFDD